MDNFEFNKNNTFCISLESVPERWERMETRFKYFNMEATRWNASTPNTLTDTFHHYLNAGQRACAQSHINIWRHIVQNDLPYSLILEDDAKFDKQWKEKLSDIKDLIDKDQDWDAIFLNVSEPMNPQNTWMKVQEQYLTGAYILSYNGAKWLFENFKHGYAASDWMTTRLQLYGHSYSYFPWLVIQEGNESTIGSGYEEDHKKVIRCLNEISYPIDEYV
jgi:GR25 family glycosyltransferase involved in LPS biosynthesis